MKPVDEGIHGFALLLLRHQAGNAENDLRLKLGAA